ncbi:hypothetical protein [Aquimarina sp. AU119]|uniref:hypothetical protein n=1 Tax=Aquimarina sp. AU119 TaxID=2108528 RepID=UPI0013586DF4|nr:hypothetical protein [Aquimarina sp. AU119]
MYKYMRGDGSIIAMELLSIGVMVKIWSMCVFNDSENRQLALILMMRKPKMIYEN